MHMPVATARRAPFVGPRSGAKAPDNPGYTNDMFTLDHALAPALTVGAILVAYCYMRRAGRRTHQAKLESLQRRIKAAEQREQDRA